MGLISLERFGNVRGELKFIANMLLVWLPRGQVGVGSMGRAEAKANHDQHIKWRA